MKEKIIVTLKDHASASFNLHMNNVLVYLTNPAGIGEHSDIMEAIQAELDKAAVHHDRLELINKYLTD